MKKTKLLLSILGMSLLISGCDSAISSNVSSTNSAESQISSTDSSQSIEERNEYRLTIKDERKLITEQPHHQDQKAGTIFKEGLRVYFRTSVERDIIALLNGTKLGWSSFSATEYRQYVFLMPSEDSTLEVYIRGDSSHVNEEIDLKENYTWIKGLKEENIRGIYTSRTTGSINPNLTTFDKYYYSDSASDIHRVYEYLNNTKIIFDYPEGVDGVGSTSLTVVSLNPETNKEEEHSITVSLNVVTVNGKYASLSAALPTLDELYGNSFMSMAVREIAVTSIDGTINYNDLFSKRYNIANMIFKERKNAEFDTALNEYNIYKFITYVGYIIFESETEFVVHPDEGEVTAYTIVNGVTFKDLKNNLIHK